MRGIEEPETECRVMFRRAYDKGTYIPPYCPIDSRGWPYYAVGALTAL